MFKAFLRINIRLKAIRHVGYGNTSPRTTESIVNI